MIRSRMTTKNCNICGKVVAVKEFLRFRTMTGYVTLRRDEISIISNGERNDVHICNNCWEGMSRQICDRLKREETLRKQWENKK